MAHGSDGGRRLPGVLPRRRRPYILPCPLVRAVAPGRCQGCGVTVWTRCARRRLDARARLLGPVPFPGRRPTRFACAGRTVTRRAHACRCTLLRRCVCSGPRPPSSRRSRAPRTPSPTPSPSTSLRKHRQTTGDGAQNAHAKWHRRRRRRQRATCGLLRASSDVPTRPPRPARIPSARTALSRAACMLGYASCPADVLATPLSGQDGCLAGVGGPQGDVQSGRGASRVRARACEVVYTCSTRSGCLRGTERPRRRAPGWTSTTVSKVVAGRPHGRHADNVGAVAECPCECAC